jgi:hypothetical protein
MSGSQFGGGATDGAPGIGSEFKQTAMDAGTRAKEKFDESTERLTDQAMSFGEEQKKMSAKQVRGIAEAAHVAARELEARMPMAASLVHSTADRLDGAAVALRERSIGQLLDDIGAFARREPVLFFGGALVAGFALSRFVKSSAADIPIDTPQEPMGAGNGGVVRGQGSARAQSDRRGAREGADHGI